MNKKEIEAVARQIMRSYCPLSWPVAWDGATEESLEGYRRTARSVIRALDKARLSTELNRLRRIEEAARSHQCPNDGSTDAVCYPPYDCPLRAALGKP